MPHVWDGMRRDLGDETVVVVPSITTGRSGTLTQAMEERSLFLLLLLRQPRLRMIYVTSSPVSEAVVEYYLGLLPGVIPQPRPRALTMVALNDATPGSLSAKLLARPADPARHPADDPEPGRLPPDPLQRHRPRARRRADAGRPDVRRRPAAAAPRHEDRLPADLRASSSILYPVGAEDLHTVDDVVDALTDMRRRRPRMVEAIVKLNDGVSGSGNAVVDLRDLPEPGAADEAERLRERVLGMALENPSIGIDAYLEDFRSGAGIVEERIIGERLTSPSVQMRALPDGTVELLSTHDQLLGGAERPGLPRLHLPRRPRVRRAHRRARHGGRPAPRRPRRDGSLRRRLRRGAGRRRRLVGRTRSSSTCARAARPTRS